jgi:Chaperone of endosialidase
VFDFPATPVTGDEYTSGGITYVFTGTVWDIASGGSMTDYVLKAGDTMTGPLNMAAGSQLSFGAQIAASYADLTKHIEMYSGTNGMGINTTVNGQFNFALKNAGHAFNFYVAAENTLCINNAGVTVTGGNLYVNGYVEVNGQPIYVDRTASGYGDSPVLQFRHGNTYTAQLYGNVSNNSGYGNWGGLDLQVTHGSYGNQNVIDVPAAQGAAVANMCAINAPAFNVTSDARLKENVRPVTSDEVDRLFGALRPVHFDRLTILGEGATPEVCERSTPEYGFVADDIARDAAELVATMTVNDADTLVYNLSQVLAVTVAKLKLLEAEVEHLRGRLSGRKR